jgi:hypothetical protein
MSYITTPTAKVREKVKALIAAQVTDITIYDYFPHDGVKPPCIVMQQIAGSTRESAMGEVINSTAKGHVVRLTFQFDVYHDTAAKRDEYTDKILYALWKYRSTLQTDGIDLFPSGRIQDLPPEQPGERLYRKSFDFLFEIYITASL